MSIQCSYGIYQFRAITEYREKPDESICVFILMSFIFFALLFLPLPLFLLVVIGFAIPICTVFIYATCGGNLVHCDLSAFFFLCQVFIQIVQYQSVKWEVDAPWSSIYLKPSRFWDFKLVRPWNPKRKRKNLEVTHHFSWAPITQMGFFEI